MSNVTVSRQHANIISWPKDILKYMCIKYNVMLFTRTTLYCHEDTFSLIGLLQTNSRTKMALNTTTCISICAISISVLVLGQVLDAGEETVMTERYYSSQ